MPTVENIPCPLCANTSGFTDVRVSTRDDHIRSYGALYEGMSVSKWKVCGRCGFVHQNPRPTTAALNKFYLDGQYHTKIEIAPDEILRTHGPCYEDEVDYAISRSGLSRGTVFDVGCGLGVALKLFKDRGWECFGVEPDSGRAEYARTSYGLDNVRQGTLTAAFDLGRKVDLVFTHHAFEHFADLPDVMTGITNILKPGGFMFTAIPTFRENRSTMSKMWMNSAHYSLFTDRSFDQLLAQFGFEEVSHRYNPWKAGPDQLGHLAQLTGARPAPEQFYEDPAEVARYLEVVNPVRSAVYLPLTGGYYGYRHHLTRAATFARQAGRVMLTEPEQFFTKAANYLRSR